MVNKLQICLALTFVACLPAIACAETVSDVVADGSGNYLLKINNKPYIALSREQAELLLKIEMERDRLREERDKLAAQLDKTQQASDNYRQLTDALQQHNRDTETLLGKYQQLSTDNLQLSEKYATAANDLVDVTKQYGSLTSRYDELTEEYRQIALRSAPRQPIDIALGLVHQNGADRAVLMAGAGSEIFSLPLRGWIFGGSNSYGLLFGVSY
jgi:septal ring factor EnvC (AmiA/AmiB activator)